jgi:thiamine pyrophosphate-dependent acetolactate synthase large subunit-like protein
VEAFGGRGDNVSKLDDLDKIIKKAIESNGFNLVNVMVDPEAYLPPSFY